MPETPRDLLTLRQLLFKDEGDREAKAAIEDLLAHPARVRKIPSAESLTSFRREITSLLSSNSAKLEAAVGLYITFATEEQSRLLVTDMIQQLCTKHDLSTAAKVLRSIEPLMPRSSDEFMDTQWQNTGMPRPPRLPATKAWTASTPARSVTGMQPDAAPVFETWLKNMDTPSSRIPQADKEAPLRALEEAARKDPTNRVLLITLGEAYLQNRDLPKAQSVCDRISKNISDAEDPTPVLRLLVALGKTYLKSGDPHMAQSVYYSMSENIPDAEDHNFVLELKDAIEAELDDPGGHRKWGYHREEAIKRRFPKDKGIG